MLDEGYLRYRIRSTEYLGEKCVTPASPSCGLQVATLSTSMPGNAPAHSALTVPGAVTRRRNSMGNWCAADVKIGSVMFRVPPSRRHRDSGRDGTLVRLAVPQPHLHPEPHRLRKLVVLEVAGRASALLEFRITQGAPWLRHFTAQFRPV